MDNKNTGNGIVLLADNTGYAQLLTTGTITAKGGTQAEQFLTASANEGWRQFGFPVSAPLAQIDDDFETYYPNGPGQVGTSNQWNVKYWIPVPSGGVGSPAFGWEVDFDNSEVIGPDSGIPGYAMYAGGLFDMYNNGILDVSGEVGNGDYTYFTYPASATVEQTTEDIGWNLVPNPYPSNIDVNALLTDATNFPLAYKAIHVWDSKTGQYQAITDDVSITFTGTTNAANTVNIAPFQAFWVKGSTTVNQSITLKNTHRTVVAQGNFFKTAPDLIRLNAIAADGELDQTIITFEQGAEDNIDGRDAYKLMSLNDAVHNMYTEVEGSKLAINRSSVPAPDKHIPMQFVASNAGQYKIDMVEETVDINWAIELEDHKTGAVHNLRAGEYSFKNDPNFTSNRFTVHINKTGRSVALNNAERVAIYGNDGGINVSFLSTKSRIADISIYNVSGQTLFNGRMNTDKTFVWPTKGIPAMYVVNVKLLTETFTEKVVR